MKVPFAVVILLLFVLLLRVEGLTTKTIAGGVIHPITQGVDASNIRLKYPVGGCVNPSNGDMFLCDYNEQTNSSTAFNRIFKVDGINKEVSVYAGNGLDQTYSGDGHEAIYAGLKPLACTCDRNGDLYILDFNNLDIRVVNGTTKIIDLFFDGSTLNGAKSIASDDTFIYVADTNNNLVKKIHKTSRQVSVVAGGGVDTSENVPATTSVITQLSGIDVDSDGHVYFCDKGAKIVRKVVNGIVSTVAGTRNSACVNLTTLCGDGDIATNGLLADPLFVHVQKDGTIVIADTGRIRYVRSGVINTLAGTGEDHESYIGGANGDGNNGTFVRIATSRNGQPNIHGLFGYDNVVYFNDKHARRYRKIVNGSVYHAFGGSISSNLDFGSGIPLINAYLGIRNPKIAFDSNNVMYISGNNGIFKVINEMVIRIAGGESGNYGNNVNAMFARLGSSLRMVFDKENNMLIADYDNHCIRMYNPSTQIISSYVGTCGVAGSPLTTPKAICLERNGTLLILDSSSLLRRFNPENSAITTVLTLNVFQSAASCVVDTNDDIYLGGRGGIFKISNGNNIARVIGDDFPCDYMGPSCGLEGDTTTQLGTIINDMAFHPITRELTWTELSNGNVAFSGIRKLSSNQVRNVIANGVSTINYSNGKWSSPYPSLDESYTKGEWSTPTSTPIYASSLAFTSTGKLFFSEGSSQGFIRTVDDHNRIISVAGHYDTSQGMSYYSGENITATAGILCKPTSVATSSNSDDLYIGLTCVTGQNFGSMTTYSRIVKLTSATNTISTIIGNFKDFTSSDGLEGLKTSVRPLKSQEGVHYPFGLQVNSLGEVYFSDSLNHRIRKMLQNSTIVTIVGNGTKCINSIDDCGDGGRPDLSFLNTPTGIFVDENSGIIYIADTFNHRIRMVKNDIITTIIGSGIQCSPPGSNSCDSTDPLKTNLNNPSSVFVTKNGDVYITDSGNSKVQKLSGGIMSVIAGSSSSCVELKQCGENVDALSAKLNRPMGIFVDESNNDVYITDQTSSIRRVSHKSKTISTFAGTMGIKGFGVNYFNSPTGILRTSNGIVLADTENGMIRLVSNQCPDKWSGLACDVTTCYGVQSNNESVCSGYGKCSNPDQCVCNEGRTGDQCQLSICNGVPENSPLVCSGHGSCVLGSCECKDEWFGALCEVTRCFSIMSNDSTVCNGLGNCTSPDSCSCTTNYLGSNCNETTCYGISSTNPTVCNGHGYCKQFDTCICNAGWFENDCSLTKCNGLLSNDSQVCGGHGSCVGPDNCKCNDHYLGSNCNETTCYGISSTNPTVCNGHGYCQQFDTCNCNSGWFGNDCSSTNCHGLLFNDSQVCGRHGLCVGPDNCKCNDHYLGFNCNETTCYGISSTTSSVCSGHGYCKQFDTCNCNSGWFGNDCSSTKCNGLLFSDSQVCGRHGLCVGPDNCKCNDHYLGFNCNETTCYGISSTNPTVCNGNGYCKQFDTCICNAGWFNSNCNSTVTNCFGLLSTDSQVCNGHGSCIGPDKCSCTTDWTGSECFDEIPQIHVDEDNILIQVDRVPIIIKQYLTCSQCNLTSSMQHMSIQWKQVSGNTVDYSILSNNNLKIASFADKSTQQYVFEVTSNYKSIIRKALVNITTQEPEFGIVLYQSSINSTHVTVGIETNPEEMLNKLLSSTWTWTCKNSELLADCDPSIMSDLAFHASKRSTLFTLAASSSKSISLKLQIKNTIGDLLVVFPQDETVPIINLLNISPQKSILTTSEKLSVQLMISVNGKYNEIESLIQREWKLNGKPLNTPVLFSPVDSSKSNLVVLDISKLSEGSTNNLTCKVTSVSSKSSTLFSYSFTVGVNPKECSCFISPTTGYAMETMFTMKCINCLTSADTLLQFSFTDATTKLQVPLSKSTSIQLTTILPYTGSTNVPIQITLSNIKTKAKVETYLNATVMLPKVTTLSEIKNKKQSWENSYKSLFSGDPKKVVYGYITTVVDYMTATLPKTRSLCMNGGIFNTETKICNCTEGFKKNDCSLTTADWLEIVNDRWSMAQLIFEEFSNNQLSENQLVIQNSLLYHLFEKFDEIGPDHFEKGLNIVKQQIQDTKSNSFITIPTDLIYTMTSIIRLLEKSQLSLEGKKSDAFNQLTIDLMSDLEAIKFRDQPLEDSVIFESNYYSVTSMKVYPTELSNKKVGQVLEFPDLITRYMNNNINIRKPITVRVWKEFITTTSNHTFETVDGVEIATSFTPINYYLYLDFGTYGQVLNIPKEEKIITYNFEVSKAKDEQVSQLTADKKMMKKTTTTSEMKCISDEPCLTVPISDTLYSCKCSSVTRVSIGEKITTTVQYTQVQDQSNLEYLGFLAFIPVVVIVLVIPIGVLFCLRAKKKKEIGNTVEMKSV